GPAMTETNFQLDGKPSITAAGTEMRSYYGRPIVKEPTWTWEVPTYFFTGGLAGASAVLSSAAQVAGNEKLARTALYVGAAAVLVADTAVPVWHDGRHELPWIFGASAAASAGAAASMFVHPKDAGPARRVAVAGVLAEGALMQAMELRLGKVGEVYHRGKAGKL